MQRTPSESLATWFPWVVWTSALVLVAVLFAASIGHEPLWLDETYSFAMSQHGFVDILRLTAGDVHPPLYYLILRATALLFGDSPVALRLPSLLATLGLLALGAGPVRRIWGERTSYFYALLVATSPGILCFAQEARMYALATLLVTGAVLYGQLVLNEERRSDLVWFGVLTWAAGMTHYFGLVAVGMNGLFLLAAATTIKHRRTKPLLAVIGLAAALYLPWFPSFVRQTTTVSHGFWIPDTSWNLLTFGLVAPFTYKFEDVPYPWQALAALGLIVALVTGSLYVSARHRPSRAFAAQLQLVAVYLLTLGFGLAFSKWVQPIFMPRYMMCCAGLLLLATAIALGHLPLLNLQVAAMVVLLGLGVPAWVRIQTDTFNGPFAVLAKQVRDAGESVPVLLHNDVQGLFPSWHAIRNARHVLLVPPNTKFDVSSGGVYDTQRLTSTSDVSAILAQARGVWVVDTEPAGFHLDPSQITRHAGWQQQGQAVSITLPMSWVRAKLVRYKRP